MRCIPILPAIALLLAAVASSAAPGPSARRAPRGAGRRAHHRVARPPQMSDAIFDASLGAMFDPEPLHRLLLKVRNPNARDRHGNTPLMYTAVAGDLPMVRQLLKRGADPNIRTSLGRTPLHWLSYSADDAAAIV